MTWYLGSGLWLLIGGICAQIEHVWEMRHQDDYLVLTPFQRAASTIGLVFAWPLWVYVTVRFWRAKKRGQR